MSLNGIGNDFLVLSLFVKNRDYFRFVTCGNSFMPFLVTDVCKIGLIDYTQGLGPARYSFALHTDYIRNHVSREPVFSSYAKFCTYKEYSLYKYDYKL